MLAVAAIVLAAALLVLVLLVSIAMLRSEKRLECAQLRDELVDAARLGQLDVAQARVFALIDWFDRVAATGRLIAVGRHAGGRGEFSRLTESLMNVMSPARRQFAPVGPTFPLGTAWPDTTVAAGADAGGDVENRAIRYQKRQLGRRRPGSSTRTRSALTSTRLASWTAGSATAGSAGDGSAGDGSASDLLALTELAEPGQSTREVTGHRPRRRRSAAAHRSAKQAPSPSAGTRRTTDADQPTSADLTTSADLATSADWLADAEKVTRNERPSGRRVAAPPEPSRAPRKPSGRRAARPDQGTSDPVVGPDSPRSREPVVGESGGREPVLVLVSVELAGLETQCIEAQARVEAQVLEVDVLEPEVTQLEVPVELPGEVVDLSNQIGPEASGKATPGGDPDGAANEAAPADEALHGGRDGRGDEASRGEALLGDDAMPDASAEAEESGPEPSLESSSMRAPLPELTPSLVDLSPRRQRRGSAKPTFLRTAHLLPGPTGKTRAHAGPAADRLRRFGADRLTSAVLRPAIGLPAWLTSRRHSGDQGPNQGPNQGIDQAQKNLRPQLSLSRKESRRKPLSREEAIVVTGRRKPKGALMPVTGPIELPSPLLSPVALDLNAADGTGSPPLSLAEQIFAIPSQ